MKKSALILIAICTFNQFDVSAQQKIMSVPRANGAVEKFLVSDIEHIRFSEEEISISFDYTEPMIIPSGSTNRIWHHITVVPVPTMLRDKKITFSSSNETVATVDEYGVISGISVGTATITVASKESASIYATLSVSVVNATYYPRNEEEGATTLWTVETSNAIVAKQTLAGAFDGVWGTTNTDANANIFGLSKPAAGNPIQFTVDMKTAQIVNVFKIIHRSGPNTNRHVRYFGFDEISGSNDGVNFTTIATNVEVANAQSSFLNVISETTFANNTPYQYIRFRAQTASFCYNNGLTNITSGSSSDETKYNMPGINLLRNNDGTYNTDINKGNVVVYSSNNGGSLQIQELYLGRY